MEYARDPDYPDARIEVRCSVCRWLTYFSVDVIHEVKDETRWVCELCAASTAEWDGFTSGTGPSSPGGSK